ncbi:hypothetical protein FRB90_003162 [Tulasnella sp. 427]|nr:hypothetical protein FRB90_003162 [Tulasnella sp. 427]
MSYRYPLDAFPDSGFNDIFGHQSYSQAPVSDSQNYSLFPVTHSRNSSETYSQPQEHCTVSGDSPNYQQQVHYEYPNLGNSVQTWAQSSAALPPSSSSFSAPYVNPQTTVGLQQNQDQRYSRRNPEYHQASHRQQHSQHTLPTPCSSAQDNTRLDSSYQTFYPPTSHPPTGSQQELLSSIPATSAHVQGSFPDGHYRPTTTFHTYEERTKLSEQASNRQPQVNVYQGDHRLNQAPVAYAYHAHHDQLQNSWSIPQGSFSHRSSSSLAHALEPVPSNPPAQQDRLQIKYETAITPPSHHAQSSPSSTSPQSQTSQIGSQATRQLPISSTPGSHQTHVVLHRPRPGQPPMPSSSTVIQIPKLPSSAITQLASPPNKLSSSPPSSQWSSPGLRDTKEEFRQRGGNVAVIIPPATRQRIPFGNEGAPIARMLSEAVANGQVPLPTLEQAMLPRISHSTTCPLPSTVSIPGSSIAQLAVQQQVAVAAAARRRGPSVTRNIGTSAQHFSPYEIAKEARDCWRKVDAARLAEMHAARVARGGSSGPPIALGLAGSPGTVSSSAFYTPPALHSQAQLPQTICIGSGSGGSGTGSGSPVERSPSSSADEGSGKEGKGGKKPFLACEFCRHRKIACGKGPAVPSDIVIPPGPRTCNQCFRRGLECQFPQASRRGLRHGKPSRRIIYGENNEYRIVDPEDEDYYDDDEEDDYLEEYVELQTKAKGKGKASVPARPWSPIRFIPAVDTDILKDLSKRGIIEKGGYA